jgi:purine-nucleoside/S-methyl-5'-thioadenosine phosphorylase / adenosine deaminase
VFYLDPLDNYRLPELDQFEWLVYGFGTRRSPPPPVSLATLRQIHSDIVVPAEGRTGCLGEGDALVSNTPGRTVAVKTADCVPILLVDAANRTVAAVHAGWRGTVRQIARQAAEAMRRDFDTRVRNLHVAIGPAIGGCCYEVGPEVAAEFGRSGRACIDLAAVNRQQLIGAGVPGKQIYSAGLCTLCRGDDFWSYRREKEGAGRMFSFAGIR